MCLQHICPVTAYIWIFVRIQDSRVFCYIYRYALLCVSVFMRIGINRADKYCVLIQVAKSVNLP
jgi:hypothetical protein